MTSKESPQFKLQPASPDEAGLFYAQMPEEDDKGGPIETQRSGFDGERRKERSRAEFSPSGGNEAGGVSSDEGQVMDQLRRGVLKDLGSMRRFCREMGGGIAGGALTQNYGYVVETDHYIYRLRCNPTPADYNAYLACFDKQAQQMGMAEQPLVGRVTFASGERLEFTDPEEYLQTVREELPFHATTGFRFETLTSDPEIRKAADDAIYHLFGEENPRELEDYQKPPDRGMTMDGL